MSNPSGSVDISVSRRVADFIAESLVSQGVTAVYGGHGGSVIPLVNAISSHPRLRWVYMRNEQAASLAASAEAKLTGRLAVCVATSGPGASHLTTGLIDALQDRVPVLAITGMKATRAVDLSEFQAIHQEELFRAAGLPFSKVVMSQDAVPAMLRNAIAVAIREKTAVHLAVPVDLQAKQVTLPPLHRQLGHMAHLEYQSSDTRIHKAARALADPALRVVIAIGNQAPLELAASTPTHALQQSPQSAYVRLAETLNAPIVTQLDSKGIVDERHPLCYGVLGIFGSPGLDAARALVQSADMVVLFGVDHQAVDLISDSDFNQVRKVVEFEPDAGSAAYHRWYDCEEVVLGDLASNARRLEAAVANLRDTPQARESYKTSVEDCRPLLAVARQWNWLLRGGWRESPAVAAAVEKETGDDAPPSRFQVDHPERPGFCHPVRVLAPLGRKMRAGDVACVDVGDITLWSSLCMCMSGGQRVLSSQGMGVMGYALPAAIAASLQRPDQHVVAIAGDGGVQMTIGELATAMQMRCRLILVVFVNTILGRVHFGFEGVSGDDIISPDFVALARAYGGDGVRVTSADEADAAVDAAWAYKGGDDGRGVFVVEVHTDPELKAEYAKMKDASPFVAQVREALADVLPTDLRPSDIRKLIAFDVHGDGMLSSEELNAARAALSRLRRDQGDPSELLRVLRTGQLFKSPMLSSIKTLLEPLEPSPFVLRDGPGGGAGTELHVVGTTSNVLRGHVPDHLRSQVFDATPYRAGFEMAALEDMDGLGEMCLCDGVVYVRETNSARPDFFTTRHASSFLTPAALLVPKAALVDHTVVMDRVLAPDGVPFVRVINDLYNSVKAPFVFTGEVEWYTCDVTCMSKAPNKGESLSACLPSYYTQPGTVLHDTRTFVCGAVTRTATSSSALDQELFNRVFFHDLTKADSSAAAISASIGTDCQVQCHVHVITYSASGAELADVWHVNPDSLVKYLKLDLFRVASIRVLDE